MDVTKLNMVKVVIGEVLSCYGVFLNEDGGLSWLYGHYVEGVEVIMGGGYSRQ